MALGAGARHLGADCRNRVSAYRAVRHAAAEGRSATADRAGAAVHRRLSRGSGAPLAAAATQGGAMNDGERVSRFKFLRPIKVVFRDVDGLRHVNHAVYLTYCETARNEYWMKICGMKRVEELDFVLAELTVRYQTAAKLGDELIVGCRVT